MKGFIKFLCDPFNTKGRYDKNYSDDGKFWINGNGNIGVNTEHPEYLDNITKSISKFTVELNKGKDMQQTTLNTHFNNFTQWSTDRKIIQNGNVLAQGLKLVSEVGELADNLAKGRCIKDDIGDCCVVLNNLVHMQGLTLDECLEQAWQDIKDRKGLMNENGVFIKEGDVE